MTAADDFVRATLPALDLVYNLARRMVPDRADAEDLVQETYLRAWQAWAAGRPGGSSRGWPPSA
jgi:RNA polymerase sigma-70 factor, ECF subfamily